SVYEERRARPGWGMDASPGFVAAYAAGRVPVPSRLNGGVMRPTYPEQIGYAYVAASLGCECIGGRHGADALPRLLRGHRAGQTTEEAFREVLGVMPDVLDRDYDAWFRERYTTQLAAVRGGAPGDSAGAPAVGGRFAEAMQAGMRALQSGDDDAALRELERAR